MRADKVHTRRLLVTLCAPTYHLVGGPEMHIEQDLEIHTADARGVKLEPRDKNALRMYYVVPARSGQRVQLTFVNNGEVDLAVEFEGLDGALVVDRWATSLNLTRRTIRWGRPLRCTGGWRSR